MTTAAEELAALCAPVPGQSQPLCQHYLTLLKGLNAALAVQVADLQRQLAGEPVTWQFVERQTRRMRDTS